MEICNGKHATLVSSWGHTRLSWLGYLLPVWWHQSYHNDFCRTCSLFCFEWACSKPYTNHGTTVLTHLHLQMVAGSLLEPWFFSACNVRLCFKPTPQGLGCVRRDGAYRERMNARIRIISPRTKLPVFGGVLHAQMVVSQIYIFVMDEPCLLQHL